MTAETTDAVPWPELGLPGARRVVRPVAGVLPDGPRHYAPIGAIVSDGITVTCHERRAAGWTWPAIAAECGQSPSWLRRQAALPDA